MNAFITDLLKSFTRDLDTLSREVALYPDDASLWVQLPGLPNSGGNLTMHLVGNVRFFIGVNLGTSTYVRNRDYEFSAREGTRLELAAFIAAAKADVQESLMNLPESKLSEPFTAHTTGLTLPTGRFLLHLATHFTFHLGQIDYHRRAVTGNPQSAGTLPMGEMV